MNQDYLVESVTGLVEIKKGYVYIEEDEADIVRMIYDMAINGHSLQNIQAELYRCGIKSPSGKDKWTRDVIDKTINNKKYLAHIIFL